MRWKIISDGCATGSVRCQEHMADCGMGCGEDKRTEVLEVRSTRDFLTPHTSRILEPRTFGLSVRPRHQHPRPMKQAMRPGIQWSPTGIWLAVVARSSDHVIVVCSPLGTLSDEVSRRRAFSRSMFDAAAPASSLCCAFPLPLPALNQPGDGSSAGHRRGKYRAGR